MDAIKQFFKEDEFDVGFIEDDEYGYIKRKNEDNYPMTFHFENNSIHLDLQISGEIGSGLLNKMEEAVKTVASIKYIRLIDGAHYEKFGSINYFTDLSLLHILTTGESWYNSLGYKSINYESEIQHNKKKLEMPCEYFFRDVFGKSLKNYILITKSEIKKKKLIIKNPEEHIDEIRKQYRDDWNKIFEPVNPETKFRGKTVRDFFIQLWQETKDVCEKFPTLRKILDYVNKSNLIEYNGTLEKKNLSHES